MRVLEVGVCGTDREISEGLFGVPADGNSLVLGHESLAVVERDGHGFSRGDLVTATVRRSCRHCLACAEGAPDSCLTGDYVRARHHAPRRLRTRARGRGPGAGDPDPGDARAGSASSPSRHRSASAPSVTRGRSAAGSPGSSSARSSSAPARSASSRPTCSASRGVDVWTASLEPSSELVTASGARYVSTADASLADLRAETGGFDLVISAVRDAQLMADSLGLLRRSGVACLLGIDGRPQSVAVDGPVLGLDAILENRVLFGSVNAHREDWLAARGLTRPCAGSLAGSARGVRRPARTARPLRGGVRPPRRQGDARPRRARGLMWNCVPVGMDGCACVSHQASTPER